MGDDGLEPAADIAGGPTAALLRLQRLAGNDATRQLIAGLATRDVGTASVATSDAAGAVVQRDAEDDEPSTAADIAQELEDIAGYMSQPVVYGAGKLLGKAAVWAANGGDSGSAGDATGQDHQTAGDGDTHLVADEDVTHDAAADADHQAADEDVTHDAAAGAGGPAGVAGGSSADQGGGWASGIVATAGASANAEAVGGDALIGLRAGDGLDVGTWARRPRVKLLQYRLDRAQGAGLKVDGMWGKRTSAALEAFQLANDMAPTSEVDAATADALSSEAGAPGQATTKTPSGPAQAGAAGAGGAPPDITSVVGADVFARWQNPLAVPYDEPLSGAASGGAAGAALATAGGPSIGPLAGLAPDQAAAQPAGGIGQSASFSGSGSSSPIATDPDTIARFQKYEPVLYDMYRRFDKATQDTQAYFALVQQSSAIAAYYGSRAFSSVCATLAGIVLGPPGVMLWNLANEIWSLGDRVADEAQRPILEAAVVPALDALFAFGNVVEESFNLAYPMREPSMPWYVVGSGAIQGPTASLLNAYQQIRSLARR